MTLLSANQNAYIFRANDKETIKNFLYHRESLSLTPSWFYQTINQVKQKKIFSNFKKKISVPLI